jgi:hypothetical protein
MHSTLAPGVQTARNNDSANSNDGKIDLSNGVYAR